MARPTPELVSALRTTAERLETGVHYRWTHPGACNSDVVAYLPAWADPLEEALEEALPGAVIPARVSAGTNRTVDEKDQAPV